MSSMFVQHAHLALDAHFFGVGASTAVLVAGALGYIVLFIAALISIVASGHDLGMKLVWLVFAFVAPFLGSLLWFMFGRANSRVAGRVS